MTRFANQPEMSFVLINRARRAGKYHRPVKLTVGYGSACGCNTRDMVQVDERVATGRYESTPCGLCWRRS